MRCKMLKAAEVHAWFEKLGVTSTPRVRASSRKALDFYERHRNSGRWAALSEEEFEKTLSDQLPGIDWSQEVAIETWNVGEMVVGNRSNTAPYGDFVTKVGTPADRLGIGSSMMLDTSGGKVSVPREFIRYRVTKRVEVLRSRASGMAIEKTGAFPILACSEIAVMRQEAEHSIWFRAPSMCWRSLSLHT
ncbi:MAG: hypothetical protein U0892_13015 [Pirellulales bacterium]